MKVYWPFAVPEYYAARSMRGDRRSIETGVTLGLSSLLMSRDTVASCLANESIKNCRHEENRGTANAHEYIDPIILSTTFGRRIAFHKSNTASVVFFYQMNGRAYACLLLRRYRLRFLSQFLYPAQVRLRAEGDCGSEKLLTTYCSVRLCCFEEPTTDPASRLGRD